jgi:Holliday junction DNA helicase RuvA
MIYALTGNVVAKREHFFVLDAHGVSFKIAAPAGVLSVLPDPPGEVKVFTYLHVREDALELYGFSNEQELALFESLNSVSGIGPKSALGIMGIARADKLAAAINEGRTELLTRASGIGKRTAERIILELRGKLSSTTAPQTLSLMESDLELEETLVALGFSQSQAKTALQEIDPKITGFKERLRAALQQRK